MTIYRSKIDHWLWILILAIILGSEIIPMFIQLEFNWEEVFILLISIILPLALVINLYTGTYYEVDDEKMTLRVKSGVLVNSKYDINKITRIRKTRTWLSSPALSFDRIEITVGRYNKVVISPKDKPQFIEHLQKLNPNISVDL